MATGIVKFFKADKGYGFIKPDDSQQDVFVHVKDIPGQQPLNQGMRVRYNLVQDPKTGKSKATNVSVL